MKRQAKIGLTIVKSRYNNTLHMNNFCIVIKNSDLNLA